MLKKSASLFALGLFAAAAAQPALAESSRRHGQEPVPVGGMMMHDGAEKMAAPAGDTMDKMSADIDLNNYGKSGTQGGRMIEGGNGGFGASKPASNYEKS